MVPCRKISIARRQLERAGDHVVRGNVVADVDERRVGTDAQHDALERAGVMIAGAEIGEECDDGPGHRPGLGARRRLAEQHLAHLALHQEGVGDAKILEQLDDVAVQQAALARARRRIGAIPQRRFIDDDVLRVERLGLNPPC